jgi:hypothetical protein
MRNNQVTPHRYDFQVPFKRYLNVAHSERVIREEKKKKKVSSDAVFLLRDNLRLDARKGEV